MTRRGMTLLELLVALSIAALGAMIAYAALATLADRRDAVRRATGDDLRATATRAMLVAWLAGARVAPSDDGPEFSVLTGTAHGMPDDQLSFLTTAATPAGTGDVVVHLAIARDARNAARGLVADLEDWRTARVTRVVLDTGIVGLDVRCATELLGEHQWVHGYISASVLPLGLEARLVPRDSAAVHPLLRLPVYVAFAGGR